MRRIFAGAVVLLAACHGGHRTAPRTVDEARATVRALAERVAAYQRSHFHGELGQPLVDGDWTPRVFDCPGAPSPDPVLWRRPPWTTLDFAVDGRSHWQLRVEGAPGRAVLVSARGDRDCNGRTSLLRIRVTREGVIEPPLEQDIDE